MDLDMWPFRAKPDHVAIVQWLVTRYAPAIHESAVRAAGVTNAIASCRAAEDFRVTRRDVEIRVRIETEIRLQMAAQRDHLLLEVLAVSAARPSQDAQLDRHLASRRWRRSGICRAGTAAVDRWRYTLRRAHDEPDRGHD